jgi:hypothetical protein
MKKLIAVSKNNCPVYLDSEATNATLHIMETPNLLELVKEVVEGIELAEDNVALEKDLGRVVGETSLLETRDEDEIVYAKRLHRDKFSRFVKNKTLTPTSFLTVILRKTDDGYNLWSAWCGKLVPTSPGEDEMPKSRGFWSNHALVYDEAIIQPNTVTTICPWD